jgi:amino acid transporter
MGNKIKSILIGRPLTNEAIHGQKLGILWGLPILASDAISSVAYASQQMLEVLRGKDNDIGLYAYVVLGFISLAIIGLLALLVLSYRQTIDSYPNGGGAYIVAKDNLGVLAGVIAGAALSVDYIMTVAVSVSSGVEQIMSLLPTKDPTSLFFRFNMPQPFMGISYTWIPVLIAVVLVSLLMIGNLRGIRESSRIFGIPPYAFILGIGSLIIFGLVKIVTGNVPAAAVPIPTFENLASPLKTMMFILVLRAFSNGCAALTGVEAVSNAVPNFKDPSVKHAKSVLLLLGLLVLALFGGTSLLATSFHASVGNGAPAVLVQLATLVFGQGSFMIYYIGITTFIILVMAANTAYSGFPLLVSIMAKEGYAPRQLNMRGDRLSYSNGIMLMSMAAILLIVVFSANVSGLIGLYAIGVFISFTLSQSGMFMRWIRHKGKHWHLKAAINGTGAIVTALVVLIISVFKFNEGAWIVVILIPVLVYLMLRVKRHYTAVSKQLRISDEAFATLDISKDHYRNRVIVPMDNINQASVRALRFAKTISDNVTAFSVAIDEEAEAKLRNRWNKLRTDIPYIIKYSPYRKVVEPLLEFIESTEYDYKKGDMITVILPQFSVRKLWNTILHNRTRIYIERQLLKHKHIVVAIMPFQLKDDKSVLGHEQYMD